MTLEELMSATVRRTREEAHSGRTDWGVPTSRRVTGSGPEKPGAPRPAAPVPTGGEVRASRVIPHR